MEPAQLEMTITKVMETEFKKFLETEMLQGEKKKLHDGRIHYKIKIYDEFKAELMQEFCLKMISHSFKASKS